MHGRDEQKALFAVRRRACDVKVRPERVTHDHAVIGFYTAGAVRFEQRGMWEVRAGDVLIVPAGEKHRVVEAEEPELWGLGFCVPCFAAEDPALNTPFERVRAGASPVVRIPDNRRAFLLQLFGEVGERARPPAVQRSLLTLIIDEVRKAAGWTDGAARGDLVAQSLAFIERRCLGPLTLGEIAEAVGRSPSHVTTVLTRATGKSAVAWIVAGRMAEARRLLLHSDERVEIIAERVGYADATHFIRMFRREHGLTPAAWRARR
jgi:AraC family transcriptional regulator, transcriptional activator of pobA